MSFQDLDFKSDRTYPARSGNLASMPSSFRFNLTIKLLMAAAVVTLLGFSVSNWQPSAKSPDSTPNLDRLHYSLPLPAPDTALQDEIAEVVEQIEPSQWESVIIKSGDTLASIFARKGISSTTTHKVATLNEQTRKLRYIQPGDEIKLLLDDQRQLRQMKYIEDITRTLLIQRNEEQAFTSQIINYQLDAFPAYREGVIDSSLFEAAANADIPEDVIMDLVAILAGTSTSRWISAAVIASALSTRSFSRTTSRFVTVAFFRRNSSMTARPIGRHTTRTRAARVTIMPRMAKACAKPSCAAR